MYGVQQTAVYDTLFLSLLKCAWFLFPVSPPFLSPLPPSLLNPLFVLSFITTYYPVSFVCLCVCSLLFIVFGGLPVFLMSYVSVLCTRFLVYTEVSRSFSAVQQRICSHSMV